MTKHATATPDRPTDLRAAFGFHAVPFTREIATDDHLRLPYLDEALAGLLTAVEARMSAALIAPAGTGKTALLRRLRSGLPGPSALARTDPPLLVKNDPVYDSGSPS